MSELFDTQNEVAILKKMVESNEHFSGLHEQIQKEWCKLTPLQKNDTAKKMQDGITLQANGVGDVVGIYNAYSGRFLYLDCATDKK